MIEPLQQVRYEFVRYTRGHGLDVGHCAGKAFPHFAAVRLADDPECAEANVREIVTVDLGRLPEVEDASCDFIVAADALRSSEVGIKEWLRCIKVGGHLCIFEPDRERYGKDPLVALTRAAATSYGLDVVRFEEWEPGGTFLVLRRTEAGFACSYEQPRPEKTCCVVRHGGFGDQIQASALFPELKRQGYHLTVLTTETGQSIIRHDPHVDEWFLVDRNQVPNAELAWFWRVTAKHYHKFINLNESVEGTFLAMPGRVQHGWPHALRHRLLNQNYAEHAAAIAEIPFRAEGKFYPTKEERSRALEHVNKLRDDANAGNTIGERDQATFNILWVLAGSSPHKFTPHQDVVVRAVLSRLRRATVTLVGDDACRILEAGWEQEPRVYCRSGELPIRDTLALAQVMDLVIGPETGVMNAVAFEPMRKIVLLSHSSAENLTKHWLNTTAIAGRSACWPCHQLHYTAEFCPQDASSGAALCQQNVSPEEIYAPIDAEYTGWARVQLLRSA